jgi:HK97 family phage prohead protease
MAKKLFTIYSMMEKAASDDGFVTIRGMASTQDTDRGGDIILAEAWTKGGLDNFNKNPIILFQHNGNRPIGKCTEIRVVERGLEITAKISKSDPVAALIEQGVITAFSVGARIRDADYLKETGGLVIKDAELYEVSAVSIPANQNALFSVVKSYGSIEELELYNKSIEKPIVEEKTIEERKSPMDKDEILKAIAEALAAQKAADATDAKTKEEERLRAEKIAKEAADAATAAVTSVVSSMTDRTEALVKTAVEAAISGTQDQISTLQKELKEKNEEVLNFVNSKRSFENNTVKDWEKAAEPMLRDAFVLGAILRKDWTQTAYGKNVIEKVNGMSGVSVPTVTAAVYENIVNTSIERDIQHALVLAPLFREIAMNAATMVLPILPDAGYAEFIATKKLTNTGDDAPNGNLEVRGAVEGSPYGGIALGSKVLSTKKIMSVSFLANETEEDTILAILPLIQEQMVRSHTRAVERAMLRGGSGIGSFDGLATIAAANSSQLTSGTAFASDALTAQDLFNMRKTMGKYGIDPRDVLYIVNEKEYYSLMDDPEFKDANLVGPQNATKLTGQVGQLYGSRVMLCDEFLTPAISTVHALAVNTRNFLVPRLRGVTLESQYIPRAQHLELVATQRLGFDQLIDGAKAVISRRYAGS